MSRTFHHASTRQDRTPLQAFGEDGYDSFKRHRGDGRRNAQRARNCKGHTFADMADDMDMTSRIGSPRQ